MYWIVIFVILSLICLGISFFLNKKSNASAAQSKIRLKILTMERLGDNSYEFTATGEQGTISFTHNIPFPVGTLIDCIINENQIIVFSSNVQREQIFKVLSKVEKWRYLGVFWIICAMIVAFAQSDRFAAMMLSLGLVLVMAFMLMMVIRSKAMYDLYVKEEKEQHIIQVDYQTLVTMDKNTYISYTNDKDETLIAMLTPKQVKKYPKNLWYHTASESILFIPKKRLQLINVATLIATILLAILIVIFYFAK